MRRLVWAVGWVFVAVWSLVAWGSYGLLNVFGDFAARNADVVIDHPESVELLAWGLASLQGLGLAAIVVVWVIVSLVILAATAVLAKIVGAASGAQTAGGFQPYHVPPQAPPAVPPRTPHRGRPPT